MRFNNRAFSEAEQLTRLVAIDGDTSGFIKDTEGFRVIGASGVASPVTGTASETALASIIIPAGAMGANGILRITALFSYSNSANNKTLRFRFGNGLSGTAFFTSVLTTTAATRATMTIQNRNSASSQIGGLTNGFLGGTSTANVTGTIDTTAQQTLSISGQLANTGETITLESYIAELRYAA